MRLAKQYVRNGYRKIGQRLRIERRVVLKRLTGTDRNQQMAQAAQSYTNASGSKHEAAGARNHISMWHITSGLDTSNVIKRCTFGILVL